MAAVRILLVDDEKGFRHLLADVLTSAGYSVEQACDGAEAWSRIAQASFDLVVTDLSMPRVSGLELLRRLRREHPETEVVVFTAHGSVEDAVEAMKLGAFDFLEKPLKDDDHLLLIIARALERRRLVARAEADRAQDGPRPVLTYGDPAMRPIERAIEKVARTDATVLLLGESGSGKEVVARAIHDASARRHGPFLVVNCATLPENLVESELFGHEKGAFTSAVERSRGRLELAAGGTFFLDEIGELPVHLQAKLLRVLQDGRFERVGGRQTIATDVRWIAATNRDLEEMMREGSFREDLYHRLAVFPITIPPLRERPADIVPLAEALLRRISRRCGRPLRLSAPSVAALTSHRWRGNVRELANALERASILAEGEEISPEDLALVAAPESAPGPRTPEPASHSVRTLDEIERAAIVEALTQSNGSRRSTAKRLGIPERTLYTKLKRYGIDDRDDQEPG